ncbi:hypothetical protein CRG98_034089 [Punica granatum]|uniref:Uncharacterized protein n=1 Tax=Punica granatum TaxID=22663 RepID=A0A2I0INJ0_PUNGR|nr:hypothetical protein CRG98_034089 [Punica granatum]
MKSKTALRQQPLFSSGSPQQTIGILFLSDGRLLASRLLLCTAKLHLHFSRPILPLLRQPPPPLGLLLFSRALSRLGCSSPAPAATIPVGLCSSAQPPFPSHQKSVLSPFASPVIGPLSAASPHPAVGPLVGPVSHPAGYPFPERRAASSSVSIELQIFLKSRDIQLSLLS